MVFLRHATMVKWHCVIDVAHGVLKRKRGPPSLVGKAAFFLTKKCSSRHNFADQCHAAFAPVFAKRFLMSETRHATERKPNLTGAGNLPALMPAYHVAAETG